MHILLAPAKTMLRHAPPLIHGVGMTAPRFQRQADMLACQMSAYSPAELAPMLKTNAAIAAEVYDDYRNYPITDTLRAAAVSYNGIVFKNLDFASLSASDMEWANMRMTVCSFLYGMLRPLDRINPYRLEGCLRLPVTGEKTVAEFWRPFLTDALIEAVDSDGGILLNLASEEMKGLFDWRRVAGSVRVVTPAFRVDKGGRLSTVTVYAKMCRGAMARYVIANRITDIDRLSEWSHEGFRMIGPTRDTMIFAALTR